MLLLAGVAEDAMRRGAMMEIAIGTGRAAEHFQKIIEAQGGNPAVVDDPAMLPQAAEVRDLFRRRGAGSSRASSRVRSAAASSRSAAAARAMEDKARSVGRLRHHGAAGRLGGAGRAAGDDLRARSRRASERPAGAARRGHHRRRGRSAAATHLAPRDADGRRPIRKCVADVDLTRCGAIPAD